MSATWQVPATAVSGVYFALLTRPDNGNQSHITFIVRSDSSHSDIVFQTSDTSWQAYNTYGGSDLYEGGKNGRAYKLSYNRPVSTRDGIGGRDFYFSNEYPLVRFLEKNGYDVSYISGVDTDRNGAGLLNHKVFLSVGHDEYWSGAQRANVEAARDAGVNLQFLSGNEMYWRTRLEPSPVDGAAAAHHHDLQGDLGKRQDRSQHPMDRYLAGSAIRCPGQRRRPARKRSDRNPVHVQLHRSAHHRQRRRR